jgi:amino acid adenylation domain-containing protein
MSAKQKDAAGISDSQVELIQDLLKHGASGVNSFPLSFTQQRLWFLDELEPGLPIYNIPAAIRLTGALDINALTSSLNEVVRRHEVLRTIFISIDGRPRQVILPSMTLRIPVDELDQFSAAEQETRVRELRDAEAREPFSLSHGPLLRARMLQLARHDHILLLTMHHIISDGWSTGLFVRELTSLYESFTDETPSSLLALEIQYADFAVWQREWAESEEHEEQLEYWRQKLQGAAHILELPTDHTRPAIRSFRGATQSVSLGKDLTQKLKELSQSEGVTLFMTLLAAFQVLLYRYTRQNDILVGTPIANRNQVETERLIGFFANTLVLRTVLSDLPFREILGSVRETCLGAYAHQELPFEKLVEVLHPERSLSNSPLFQVMFVLRNAPQTPLALPDLTLQLMDAHSATAKFDLTLSITEAGQELQGSLEYSTDLFEAGTIKGMVQHLTTLLEGIAAGPEQRISELPLLSVAERERLLTGWNETQRAFEGEKCLHEGFEAQVEKTPDAIAVVFEQEQLSYGELNRRANQLAHYLTRLGVGPETLVGLCLERSVDLIVAVLGVLKAGGGYFPLDPASPRQRLSFMLADSLAPVVLTQERLRSRLPEYAGTIVSLDSEWPAIACEPEENFESGVRVENVAYVIYTSGSTGQPKGVAVEQRQILNYIHAISERVKFESGASYAMVQPLTVDAAQTVLFPPLYAGGTVHLISPERATDAVAMSEYFGAHAIDCLKIAPSHLEALHQTGQGKRLMPRRSLVLGGESPRREWIEELRGSAPGCEIVNHYGPTETTVAMLTYGVNGSSAPFATGVMPLGRPLANTRAYVLDNELQPVPVGVIGELFIGGECVTRGYLGQPEKTAQQFIPDPFSAEPGARLYLTGDLVRYEAGGNLIFIGRKDEQLKIRGYRVEPAEIEAALVEHEAVRECIAMRREDVAGDPRLVAYCVCGEEVQPSASELRSFLAERLPVHMLPSAFVLLAALPLTGHGKVDRNKLPAPDQTRAATAEYTAPRTSVEMQLAAIWQEVLGVERVSINDNFFDLGGHSLLATQVISRVRESFRIKLPLRALFEAPTVELLAIRVAAELEEATVELDGPRVVERQANGMPLSFAQQRMWFMQQLEPESSAYHIPGAVRLRGPLAVRELEQSLHEIIERHESLRTVFPATAGQPLQQVLDGVEWQLGELDLSTLIAEEQEREVSAIMRSQITMNFDLSTGPLFRVTLVRVAPDEHLLLLVLHHIIADGWSMDALLRELVSVYESRRRGEQSQLPALRVQYVDYAQWQRETLSGDVLAEQERYWKEQLADAPPVLELPIDAPRLARKNLRGSTRSFSLEQSLTERLRKISRENETTLFMTLLAAFKVLLYRHTAQSDIVIGTPIANRTRSEIEPLIGFFVNTLVLRTELNGNSSFSELLKRVREVCLGAYAHQDMPFEKLVELLQPDRELTHAPLFQVTFALQNAPRELSESTTLEWSILDVETETAKFDLSLHLVEAEDGLRGSLQYNVELFSSETIEGLVSNYESVLRAVAESTEQRIGEISLLKDAERQQVLEGWNWTERKYDRTRTVVELFEEQVALHPEALAVVYEEEEITYRELNRRANQVAHYLQQQGVGPEVLVGICLERSAEMVVGLLGTLKAGGAYLPLDPAYPRERLAFMLDDAGIRVLLTSEQLSSTLPATSALVVPLDSALQQSLPDHNPLHDVDALNLAYVIYTSGSTGRPKAVLVQHESLLNLVLWHQDRFNVSAADRATQLASLAFDAAVWELWPYLTTGGCVCLLRDAASLTAEELRDWLIEHSVTMSFLPTPLAERVLNLDWPERIPLRTLLTGGDRLRTNKDASLPFALVNNYGPTECTVVATSGEVQSKDDSSSEPSIGRPIANTNVYVVNEWLEPAPVGTTGELVIGGAGVARGYHDQPNMTAEQFTPDPFTGKEGSRVYRTGDVVRWRRNGELEFICRKDGQIKVRGYRVELGEVEAALEQHDSIKQSVVAVREGERGDGRLVGYLVPVGGQTLALNELREYLAGKLPHYMVPTAFVILDELPLTANGKIDHKALPLPDGSQLFGEREYVEPGNPTEQIIANIWAEVLGLDRVGANDNFFELGGHSLLATQVISRVRESFKIELPLRTLFESPEVRALAEKIAATMPGADLEGPRRVERRAEGMPLSFAQQRLWFMQQWELESATYNIPTAVRLSGELVVPALEQSLQEIIRRHESLRTRFIVEAGEVRQQITEEWAVRLTVEDLEAESVEARDEVLEQEIRKPFDLNQVPLLRVRLLRVAANEHVLLLVVHHIIADGWSMGVLLRELVSLYESRRRGEQSDLPQLEVQYVDYAEWQRERLSGDALSEQERYWKEQLADASPILELPADRVRPTVQTFSGGRESLKLSAELSERLKVVSRQTDVTLFMVLLAAFQILLSRQTGQDDIVVGTPTAGRNHRSIESLIGIFLNTLVLRTGLSGNPTFRELLARVREVCLGAYAHQEMPFEKLLEILQPVRVLSHTPLVQVYFNMLNLPGSRIELPDLVVENMALPEGGSKFDLTLYLKEQTDGIQLTLVYNKDLFDAARMSMFLAQYEYLLGQALENIDENIEQFSLAAPAMLGVLPDMAQSLTSHWNGAIHEIFAAQALRNPENAAVLDGLDAWTYRGLNERSNQLAHYLLARGIPKGSAIAVMGHRSAPLICGLLGILKAGAAFTILDPTYPDARLLEYLNAVEPSGFLQLEAAGKLSPVVQEFVDSLPLHCHLVLRRQGSIGVTELETDEILREFPVSNPSVAIDADSLAYIAFTSGSTGKPKGILGRHQSLSLFGRWASEVFGVGESDRFSLLSGLSHDPLHRDVLTPLQLGATICVPDPEGIGRPGWLAQWFNREKISVANLTPAMGQLLSETLAPEERLTSLRHVFFIGDVLSRLAVSSLRRIAPEANCVNLYGATETQRAVSFFVVPRNDSEAGVTTEKDILPVGRGIKEVQLLVLNNAGRLAGIGEVGEVCFRSPHLSGGYLGDELLTREKFVINQVTNLPHDRIYRSGDLGRYLPDGNVTLIGRRDSQVKIRGYRVELSEIEGVLGAYAGVKDCAVLAHEYVPDDKRLVAYVVLHDDRSVTTSELRQFVGGRLPQYMVPSQYVFLPTLPLTPNGKLNRKALVAPDNRASDNDAGYVAPRTPIEEKLAAIWKNLLGVGRVGIHDNFFELGGHSLLATRMISHLRDETDIELSLRFLFASPTIAEIALFVVQHQAAQKEDLQLESLLAGLEQLSEDDLQAILSDASAWQPAEQAQA